LDVETISSFYDEFETWGALTERARQREEASMADAEDDDFVVLSQRSPSLVRFCALKLSLRLARS